jgi:2-oxoglutarate dehydrogenase E1 component
MAVESQSGVQGGPGSINSWSAEYLDSLYEQYRADPDSVPEDAKAFFLGFDLALSKEGEAALHAGPGAGGASPFQSGVDELINAYRECGHLCAQIDPFDRARPRLKQLELSHYGLAEKDLDRRVEASLKAGATSGTLREILGHLEQTYCRTIGLEFMHIRSDAEREWFLKNYEQRRGMSKLSKEQRIRVLEQLTRAEGFEGFCHRRYASEKRFSLEGGVSLIPLMDAAIERASDLGVESMVIGMAHRGRLNVLNNILGKTYEQIFTEFEDNWEAGFADGGGDVKYHRGYSGDRQLANGRMMHLAMPSNPSHLESVNPVVLGRCRAKQRMQNDKDHSKVVPILIHGDAAIAGQGIVAECLNMSQLQGYTCGGCVHVVINNMIGFTTIPEDARSSTYCTDVAKMTDAPVFHVNGEDPEACVAVAKLAMEYRQAFKKDVFIDMYCYRKYGHNEQDEQSYTQPTLAAMIQSRESTLTLYTQKLRAEGVIDEAGATLISEGLKTLLDQAQEAAKKKPHDPTIDPGSARWGGMGNAYSHAPVETGVPLAALEEICTALGTVPEGFTVNPKLVKLLEDRRSIVKAGKVSHADAELLAFGSLLIEGIPVRLSGQDVRRGTFSHRHAVLRDFHSGEPFTPLDNVREVGEWATDHEPGTPGPDGKTRQARFCVWDSPLSEYAVLGFDYGYSQADPNMLVVWEAQFGDFCNGTQVIFDQYLASSEIKWERWSGLTILLPHGYEGAGPEHSSCRIERFLQLCSNDNMQVVNPTTGAQMFHLLRRQLKRGFRKPLIVPAPKSMLRVPTSDIADLTRGSFQELLDDPAFAGTKNDGVKRVILCSGKIYHEMNDRRTANGRKDVAIVRLEQMYPFHTDMAKAILATYPKGAEVVWVQEEPRNAGAYLFVADLFKAQFGMDLKYIGRPASATPAVGSKKAHKHEQEDIISAAVGPVAKDGGKGGH